MRDALREGVGKRCAMRAGSAGTACPGSRQHDAEDLSAASRHAGDAPAPAAVAEAPALRAANPGSAYGLGLSPELRKLFPLTSEPRCSKGWGALPAPGAGACPRPPRRAGGALGWERTFWCFLKSQVGKLR